MLRRLREKNVKDCGVEMVKKKIQSRETLNVKWKSRPKKLHIRQKFKKMVCQRRPTNVIIVDILSDKIVTMKYSQRNENLDFWFREAK
jgi:hypothetical protein